MKERTIVTLLITTLAFGSLGACGSDGATKQETDSTKTDIATVGNDSNASDVEALVEEPVVNEAVETESTDSANIDLMRAEIAAFRERREKIDADEKIDPRLGGNMSQMREAAGEYAQMRTELMNDLYAYLIALPEVDGEDLAATQADWETAQQEELDELAEAAKNDHRSGNAYGMEYASISTNGVNQRLDELFAIADSLV